MSEQMPKPGMAFVAISQQEYRDLFNGMQSAQNCFDGMEEHGLAETMENCLVTLNRVMMRVTRSPIES